MADDAVYSDLLDSLSPLTKAGIDPDQARLDRAGTMAKLLPPDGSALPSWMNQDQGNAPATPTPTITGRVQPSVSAQTTRPAQPLTQAQPITPAQSAVPSSVTPSGDQTKPSLAAGNAATIGQMQQDYTKASQDVNNEASQPGIDTTTAALEAQRAKDATPIQAYDPQTGKVVGPYKPSFGQRLARGAEGVLRGGIFTPQAVLGAIDPAAVGGTGYGAPTAQYGRDVQQQQAKVASDDQQLKNAADNWKATSERLKQIAADRRALSTTGKDVTGASIAQQDQPNKDALATAATQNAASEAARAYNDSPAGKAEAARELNTQSLAERREQIADPTNPVSKASKSDQAYFMANGKLPEPDRYHAPAELQMFHGAYQAWQKQHPGKQPTVDDLRDITAASKGQNGGANLMVPDGKGGFISKIVRPGDSVPAGSVSVAGMSSMNVPTASTRTMAEMAKTVLPMMDDVSKQVDDMAAAIGPATGRWNQLMTNKGGKDYPEFAKLDTNLDLLASAIVRTHFGARGGQEYRQELRKQFGEAQSPEDLKARIAGANKWIEGYAHMADAGGGKGDDTGGATGKPDYEYVPGKGMVKQ